MAGDGLLRRVDGFLKRLASRKTARQVRYGNPVNALDIFVDHNRVSHISGPPISSWLADRCCAGYRWESPCWGASR